jgi:hypothetical protein
MAIGLLNKVRSTTAPHRGQCGLPAQDLTLNMAYAEACPISAAGFILAAFDPSLAHHNGSCLADCQVDDDVVHDHAKGEENANRAWELSLPLVTCKA